MDYTSIHVYGHMLSDDILRSIEQDTSLSGNREMDFGIDHSTTASINYVWSSLRTDWRFFQERSLAKDPYGTRRARDLMERFFQSLGYSLIRQNTYVEAQGKAFEINYLCPELGNLPFIVIGDRISEQGSVDTLDKCSLDYRAKGSQRKRSAHATMLEYLNATENVYGIISNGQTLRLIRNSGQLVKVTYIEFDLRRMLEEDKYTEFCLLFRLLHASRFATLGDEPCVLERWFNMSIESGNRIREGLSRAAQTAMEKIGQAVLTTAGEGNEQLRQDILTGKATPAVLNKELMRFIYRLLFLFIIEDRGLVYQIPDDPKNSHYQRLCQWQAIYNRHYAASRLRGLSERQYLKNSHYFDLWQGLMDTFRLFENDDFGQPLGIQPLGGMLFDKDTLHYLKHCQVSNRAVLEAFSALNEFTDARGQRVKINYSSLDVEEFGSVYEGILEMQPTIQSAADKADWHFGYVGGLDRQSTSSYYTRPDLVQNLIRTTLEPVIQQKIAAMPTVEEKVKALLSMKVCDAAAGSGHIVLAMARTIAWYVCTLRTGEDNPASLDYREALREVIQKCVYAVDMNPDAVELCKVVLWIEGYCAGKPLSFLDSHIRCGNSVVGVSDLQQLLQGVPSAALNAADREVKRKLLNLNNAALADVALVQKGSQDGFNLSLFTHDATIQNINSEQIGIAKAVSLISRLPEDTLAQEVQKKARWEELMASPRVDYLRLACNIFTYAFYKQFTADDLVSVVDDSGAFTPFNIPYTRTVFQALQEIKYLDDDDSTPSAQHLPEAFCNEVTEAAAERRFFHWCIEFPEVFANQGGFDVMCGNPPWDKMQMEDEKWFVGKNMDIVHAANQNVRNKLIDRLQETDPTLYAAYQEARNGIAGDCSFIKNAQRFELCNKGKLELSYLFAELNMNFSKEAWGIVCPTSIAFGDSSKYFFEKLVTENRLISLFDFENREKLFDIHAMFKFCLLTAGKKQDQPREVKGGFYLTRLNHLLDPARIYTLQTSDFAVLNPNTKTCPIFRTSRDAALTKKIYAHAPILINNETNNNPWDVRFSTLFNMATHSNLFYTKEQMEAMGCVKEHDYYLNHGKKYVPLYEGKMFWLYNHHYGSFPHVSNRPSAIPNTEQTLLEDPQSPIYPWYWVESTHVKNRLRKTDRDGNILWEWKHNYYIAFRDVTNATNERTCVASLMPSGVAAGHKAPLVFTSRSLIPSACLLGTLSSIVFDYAARQKVGGSSLSFFIMEQLPVLSPERFSDQDKMLIVPRVLELTYFNHDMDGWADELWEEMDEPMRQGVMERLRVCNGVEVPLTLATRHDLVPFRYQEARRAVVQAELDAIYAHLYGLTTEELRYILDPEDVCGKGCINETFRVLKDNEQRRYGEYRTKRLVLAAWHDFGYDNSYTF